MAVSITHCMTIRANGMAISMPLEPKSPTTQAVLQSPATNRSRSRVRIIQFGKTFHGKKETKAAIYMGKRSKSRSITIILMAAPIIHYTTAKAHGMVISMPTEQN